MPNINKITKIRPTYTSIVTTADRYEEDVKNNSVITKTSGSLKEYQTVIAVGSSVREVKVGDVIVINPTRYQIKKHEAGSLKDGVITDNPVIAYNFPTVVINDETYLKLQENDVDYIVEDYEEEKPNINLVMPSEKKIILN